MDQEMTDLILTTAKSLLGIPYVFGAKWTDLSKPPAALDCSGFVEGVYLKSGLHLPDGSQNQYDFTKPIAVQDAVPTDLAFFGRNKDPKQIYHVGMLFDKDNIIEARAFDGLDWTGKVTLRGKTFWENWENFLGYRRLI